MRAADTTPIPKVAYIVCVGPVLAYYFDGQSRPDRRHTPHRPMRKSTVKSFSAVVMLVSMLALAACNRGYGCPNAIEADAGQPAAVK